MLNKEQVIEILEEERQELLAKLASLEMTILTFKQSLAIPSLIIAPHHGNGKLIKSLNLSSDKYIGYLSLKTRQKALSILRNEGRFLHMREIVKIAQSLEPNGDPKEVGKQISTSIYNMKNMADSTIVNFSPDDSNRNTFWGSRNWLDEKGNIKKEHMYNESEVSVKSPSLEI